MSLYSERPAIPRRTVFSLESGRLGEELMAERTTRDAIVREIDVDVLMTVEAAESLCKWLGGKVEELKKTKRVVQTGQQENDDE